MFRQSFYSVGDNDRLSAQINFSSERTIFVWWEKIWFETSWSPVHHDDQPHVLHGRRLRPPRHPRGRAGTDCWRKCLKRCVALESDWIALGDSPPFCVWIFDRDRKICRLQRRSRHQLASSSHLRGDYLPTWYVRWGRKYPGFRGRVPTSNKQIREYWELGSRNCGILSSRRGFGDRKKKWEEKVIDKD